MTESLTIPEIINKEMIANLRFPEAEVLTSKDAMSKRRAELERALSLGNLEHAKVRIIFEDADNVKQVETTVWGLTEQRVILKQGMVIPIHRIHLVKV